VFSFRTPFDRGRIAIWIQKIDVGKIGIAEQNNCGTIGLSILRSKIEDEDEDEFEDDNRSSKTPKHGAEILFAPMLGSRDDREKRHDLCPDQMRTDRL
jgi:hypothetical protein